ncbi:ankyrin repeat domain-containing protein 26-like [Lynx rufus]|uniref:ankyrin repeat domain-containing protein 26-like n=1 Tax=Lynx rufus TaxID=61384 RepID=UPI001F127414|nr:ankyrin repeat domain-containing protein 26-like [Lynx rufus]
MLNTELKATKNQVVEERSDTQWQLSPEQKARVLQDGSLNNLFCKQKELEMAHKKTNSKVVARQLQQELADTLKKKSMSEASPEVTSYLRLEDETRDLKKKLGQIRSQLQEAQERHAEAVRYAEKIKDHMLKLKVKNARQEATIKHQVAQIQDLQSNLLKASLYQVPLKVEEKKKHRGSDMEVSENIHGAAAAGLIPQRQNGKTDNHQLPITENKHSDRREPGLQMKKLKKGENEKGTSKGSVITPVLQKADSLTGGPLQKNDGSHFSEKDQHESRTAKKISKKKNKVKKQITSMDDLVDFIQSSETASEHCELPYSKNFMLLIEQLGMDCKDYAGFLKIQDIRVSYEKLRKLNKNHCKLLMGKMTKMDKMVSALQNELQEAKDMISRLEHQKVEWEREFCSLRCTLKQEEEEEEEERRNADMLYENIREKLRRKEDEYKKEVETKQQVELALRMLNTELKATKNQVVEERSDTQWQLSPEQKARVLQDGSLNNLFCKQKELEMAHKKTNSKVVARQLQQELADTLKKKSMSEASPEVTSYLRLEDETRDLKKKLGQIRSQLQEEQERHGEAIRYAEEMKDHVQKLQVKNATQEATIKHQAAQIQDLENNVIKSSLYQVPLKVEEKKKHRGSDMEVSENIHGAAAAGLIPQRQNGKTDNHQLPITENKHSDRREPGLQMKKLKKGENEKGTSKGSVITPVLQKADSLTGGPLQKNDGSHFSEKDQHESRTAKKISKKKNKVKKQITSMDDLVDFIQSSETASEHCELPYSKNFMLLIEQLGMDCKDYAGFLKIQDIRVSYEKLRKLNKNHCKLLMGKMTKMDKMVSALQNELQEAKDMISRLEHQKVEWEREFCSLRCTLKQEEEEEEEERRNADMLYENIREKLRRKEDEYKKEVETKQQVELALRMLNTELKATKNQVVEERSDTQWQLSPEQKARVLQDGSLNNLFCKQKELEMAHKKTNSKVVVRQLQQELADTLKKKSMSEASPEVTSYLRLEDETRDLKKKLGQIRSQAMVSVVEAELFCYDLKVAINQHVEERVAGSKNILLTAALGRLQEEQERHGEAIRYAEEMKDHVQKLQVKNATQEATIKHQAAQIQDLENNVIKSSLAIVSVVEAELFCYDLKVAIIQHVVLKFKNATQEATIKHQAAQIQDLQSNLLKASLLQEAKDREAKDIRYAEKTLEVQNARQEETIKQQAAQIQDLQTNLLRTSRADVLTTELETTSSKCLHLDAKNQVLQQELLSMKAFEEEREKLESNNKKLQQEVVKLKQFMEMNMVERSQVEQYKREIEERARLDIVEKLHEVNLFLQEQAAARKNLDQLRENDHASTINKMELRIKDLESQVSTMKTSQGSTKTELETYRQLYLEELKLRKSLRNKLNRAKERLSESNTNFLVERQQHQTLLRTLTMSPGLEPPYCGHFENNLVLNGNFTPRGNLVIPTINPRLSYDDREASLWKTRQELEERITRELEEAATEFE